MAVYSDIRKAIRRGAIQSLLEFFPTVAEQDKYIIFSHVSGVEPINPYVVINILSIEQLGRHSTSTLTNTDKELLIQVAYEVNVQFTFCGSSSGDMAQSFTQRINNNPLSLEALKANKLSVLRKSNIRRNPRLRDTKWVEYLNQDVVFSYIVQTKQVVDWVDGIVVETDLDEDSENVSIPPNIVYP